MAKDKQSSEGSTIKKAAAKKSSAKKSAAPKKPAVQEAASVVLKAAAAVGAAQSRPSASELYEQIRIRAYELYRERGGHHGSHEADWHRAESEVKAKYKT
jgi:hypothetical protein